MEGPVIFKDKKEIPTTAKLVEAYTNSLEELFFIENPQFKKGMPGVSEALHDFLSNASYDHIWVYYPWCNTAVHTLPEDIYFKLRTSRNRHVIHDDEQIAYRNLSVGVAGLSVGSAIVSALVVSGGPKNIKIADFDTVEVTNLNRIRASLLDVGINKTEITARNVWELDPFANLELWSSGITKETLEKFLLDKKLDVFIDEMDSLDLKIAARFICREHKIPVVMATDNGDGVILDIERFDTEDNLPIFHGLLGEVKPEDFGDMDYRKWLQLATKIVGPEYLTPRMQESIMAIGKTIPSVPQLGPSATMAGATVAYTVRQIANKNKIVSGRYTVSLEEKLVPGFNSPESIKSRQEATEVFKNNFSK